MIRVPVPGQVVSKPATAEPYRFAELLSISIEKPKGPPDRSGALSAVTGRIIYQDDGQIDTVPVSELTPQDRTRHLEITLVETIPA